MSREKLLMLLMLEQSMQQLYTAESHSERVLAGIRCDLLEAGLADLDSSPSA